MERLWPVEQSNLPSNKIGVDIVYLPRLSNKTENNEFINKILTPNEKELYFKLTSSRRKLEFLGGRFAAKEAYSKALGTGIGETDFLDVEITYDERGKPFSNKMEVSISHDQDYVIAMVMIYVK